MTVCGNFWVSTPAPNPEDSGVSQQRSATHKDQGRGSCAIDCCKVDEVTLPKFYHLDLWSITLSDSKIVFVLALAAIELKILIFKKLESRKIRLTCFVICMLLERWEVESDIFSCTLVRNFGNFGTGRILCEVNFWMEAFWILPKKHVQGVQSARRLLFQHGRHVIVRRDSCSIIGRRKTTFLSLCKLIN